MLSSLSLLLVSTISFVSADPGILDDITTDFDKPHHSHTKGSYDFEPTTPPLLANAAAVKRGSEQSQGLTESCDGSSDGTICSFWDITTVSSFVSAITFSQYKLSSITNGLESTSSTSANTAIGSASGTTERPDANSTTLHSWTGPIPTGPWLPAGLSSTAIPFGNSTNWSGVTTAFFTSAGGTGIVSVSATDTGIFANTTSLKPPVATISSVSIETTEVATSSMNTTNNNSASSARFGTAPFTSINSVNPIQTSGSLMAPSTNSTSTSAAPGQSPCMSHTSNSSYPSTLTIAFLGTTYTIPEPSYPSWSYLSTILGDPLNSPNISATRTDSLTVSSNTSQPNPISSDMVPNSVSTHTSCYTTMKRPSITKDVVSGMAPVTQSPVVICWGFSCEDDVCTDFVTTQPPADSSTSFGTALVSPLTVASLRPFVNTTAPWGTAMTTPLLSATGSVSATASQTSPPMASSTNNFNASNTLSASSPIRQSSETQNPTSMPMATTTLQGTSTDNDTMPTPASSSNIEGNGTNPTISILSSFPTTITFTLDNSTITLTTVPMTGMPSDFSMWPDWTMPSTLATTTSITMSISMSGDPVASSAINRSAGLYLAREWGNHGRRNFRLRRE